MRRIYHLGNKLFTDKNNKIFHETNNDPFFYEEPPVFDFPEDDQPNNVTGTTTNNFIEQNTSLPKYPCGIVVSPDESMLYIKRQSGKNFYMIAANGDLIKQSAPIPNYSGFTSSMQDGKIYLMNNKQYLLSAYDTKTMVKHDLAGNYISHYVVPRAKFHMADFAEDPNTGNIYISSRYGHGIQVCDANFNSINFFPVFTTKNIDCIGIAILNNMLYVAPYGSHTNTLLKMNLDGTNITQIPLPNAGSLFDVKPSSDKNSLFVLGYTNGMLTNLNPMTNTINFQMVAIPRRGGSAMYVDLWGNYVYAVSLYVNTHLVAKVS